MQNKHYFTIIYKILCDIRQNDNLFNEIFIIIRNDFAQITLIISINNRAAQINVNIRSF